MAALCVHSVPPPPVECHAQSLLDQASVALANRAFIECGCYLREALREYLCAECLYHGCPPREKPGVFAASPRSLASLLKRRNVLDADLFEWIVEVVDVSNKAVHLHFVPPSRLEAGIGRLQSFLDQSPYLVTPSSTARRMS